MRVRGYSVVRFAARILLASAIALAASDFLAGRSWLVLGTALATGVAVFSLDASLPVLRRRAGPGEEEGQPHPAGADTPADDGSRQREP
jgi:hypothetical protein